MTRGRMFRVLFAVISLPVIAGATPLAAATQVTGKALKVTSTLDGKTVLPHRIHWLGLPALPQTQVREVDFLIDGSVRWIEHGAPYSYSDDGGYLVTSWLAPGRHRFTVRVRSRDGRTGTDTVLARVLPAPPSPTQLAGTWQRDVRAAVPAYPPGPSGDAPAGKWTLDFDGRWIQDRAPGKWDPNSDSEFGGIVRNDWWPGAKTFVIAGPVTTNLIRDDDPVGGWWCEAWGPSATYTWSVQGDELTLAPVGGVDACHQRGAIYTGHWTRVH